ncbi:MAG: tRNA uridine-5-carboxymethylaminomethyl(34) synthesis enzyme MnmG [Clostridia bacterium]|nr:tRNA uridine-5-carboxymethylaminomethyl(34) synthesis enzyme MnmG [Clostridia bacterium]MBO5338925.1 tRNA uridine-5-carboxymethylaminomethyl(34) synthesis enzyme MnmG [Clostridia bacterium]
MCNNSNNIDVAVVGAGHAGIEAALASARMGLNTILFTMSLDAVANLPCNPSIGGTAKGHLVYEIDALGGEMGRSADLVTLQARTLNLGKGAAVYSKRIQADRLKYRSIMKGVLENTPNLRLVQAEICDIKTVLENGEKRIDAVVTRLGEEFKCKAVILCTGTYLNATVHTGNICYHSGPDSLMHASFLTDALIREGISMMRFKTGTPARIHADSIDYSQLEIQEGEVGSFPFSWRTDEDSYPLKEQVPCYIAYTNLDTHKIIKDNLTKSAMYSGNIHGTGPRYCPSIEDKIVRFADKERHQLFLEPTGSDTKEMYLQGFSTSMPIEVQMEMLHSLKGFENAKVMRYAYAIEYDCTDPQELLATLEYKKISGLYGAGQFNGTSGYEEAGAQGLVAGINASLKILGKEPMILPRSSSYIGTLIDDLVTKGTHEPYRMMTSRSEYRLLLRQDNADLRLTPIGREVGLVNDLQWAHFEKRRNQINDEKNRLSKVIIYPTDEVNKIIEEAGTTKISTPISLADLIKRPQLDLSMFENLDTSRPNLPKSVVFTAQTDIKYDGYVKKQLTEVARAEKMEAKPLDPDLDYSLVKGLRIEAVQKLNKVKPLTLGQASRISGVSPADISVLMIYLQSK